MLSWGQGVKGRTLRKAGVCGVAMIFLLPLISVCSPANPHIEGTPYHHLQGGFRNPPGSPEYAGTWGDRISAYTDRMWESFTGYAPTVSPEYILAPEKVRKGVAQTKGKDALTWLGHATFVIRLGGKTILTDPFLTKFATGMPPFGPERATPPALDIGELPQIDIIVVSHNHYDHLDAETVEALPGKDRIHVIVPLGLGVFFTERGYSLVTELDWYDSTEVEGVTVTATPAIHNSRRGLFDRNAALWAGYAFKSNHKQVFFCGDSAYGPVYTEIGQKIGPVDYALLPIGTFEPRQRMKSNHMNPVESLKVAQDLHAKTIVAMHWGTIRLSDEPFEEPPRRFRQVADDNGYSGETAWLLKIGESRLLK